MISQFRRDEKFSGKIGEGANDDMRSYLMAMLN